MQTIEANWIAFALALAIGVLVAWWLFGRSSGSARQRHHAPDVLDEGAAPAARNQALIDAPSASAAALSAGLPDVLAGVPEVVAHGAEEILEDAEEQAAPPVGDDLSRIKGLGPKLQALLPTLGLATYAQIAALTDADLAELDGKLGAFAGRPAKDNWVEQARFLAAGDVAGFEAKFGKV
jgi:predicted flap endonuclease-1-like 5' DNA nuclease